MSLLTGLLNKTCSVLRPIFSDTNGNEIITGYTTIATQVPMLFSQKNSTFPTADGGRNSIETYTVYMEWVEETQLVVNDVLTHIVDGFGSVETDMVNGKQTDASYKVISRNDPNGERDHLEIGVEHYHGRVEGQP